MQFDSIPAAVEPAPREMVIAFARSLLAARKLRNELLFEVDFDDIEWFVLVDLFIAAETGTTLSLSDLYNVCTTPRTTVLSAITRLVDLGLLVRQLDPKDGRRKLVYLSPETLERVRFMLCRMRDGLLGRRPHDPSAPSGP
jgi:DNA-binding MarR family transcriptional regulator